jgi:hypothetical protein
MGLSTKGRFADETASIRRIRVSKFRGCFVVQQRRGDRIVDAITAVMVAFSQCLRRAIESRCEFRGSRTCCLFYGSGLAARLSPPNGGMEESHRRLQILCVESQMECCPYARRFAGVPLRTIRLNRK